MERKGFFGRLAGLWRGFWGTKLSDAEAKNAEAVYHNAIADHVRHHDRLKEAIARLVYLRNRIEAEHQEQSKDLALVEAALAKAVAKGDDDNALALIRKKRQLESDCDRLANELVAMTEQSKKAKEGLQEVQIAVRSLKQERGEMLARKAHALARRDAQEALRRISDQSQILGSVSALENVRESIARLEQEVGMEDEETRLPGEISMEQLRREAAEVADRTELSRLKEELGGDLVIEQPKELTAGKREEEQPLVSAELRSEAVA